MADIVRRHRGWTARCPLIPNKNIRPGRDDAASCDNRTHDCLALEHASTRIGLREKRTARRAGRLNIPLAKCPAV